MTSRADKVVHLLRGLTGRIRHRKTCPCCGSRHSGPLDWKFFHSLEQCSECKILYRFPYEAPNQMARFYQRDYSEAGLTTDLPSEAELQLLVASRFRRSEKDFGQVIEMLQALGLGPGAKILDFGANWGYGTYQLRLAGYITDAYEISQPRASFGKKIGVDVLTSLDLVGSAYDAIYSSHVLEHVPNPRSTLQEQFARLKPGGYIVAATPNGSTERRRANPHGFHLNWGLVHPVLLTSEFLLKNFAVPRFVSTSRTASTLKQWDKVGTLLGPLDGEELVFVLRKC
jgi:SAM-dependent methyltransferase